MTTRDVYDGIGDYDRMTACIANEESIRKFLRMFMQDENYGILQKAMEEGDVSNAFYGAHTLKGVCQNLCLFSLYEVDYTITEALREGDMDEARKHMPQLKERYEQAILRIAEMDD